MSIYFQEIVNQLNELDYESIISKLQSMSNLLNAEMENSFQEKEKELFEKLKDVRSIDSLITLGQKRSASRSEIKILFPLIERLYHNGEITEERYERIKLLLR